MDRPENTGSSAECVAPPALNDENLLAVLDNDPHSGQIDLHLERCAYCRARLERMRMDEETLRKVMYRVDCPSADKLADYVIESLSLSESREIDQHLQSCSLCRKEVATLRAIVQVDEPQTAVKPPGEPIWEEVKGFFRDLEDQLVRLLLPQPSVAYGQLKGSAPQGRLLSYGSDALSVMLSLDKVIDGLRINGSIIDAEAQGKWNEGFVELNGADKQRYIALIDEDETFTFATVTPGQFSLSIFAETGEILRLQEIDLTL